MVYFLMEKREEGLVKIGFTGKLEGRMGTLRQGNPYDLEIIAIIPNDDSKTDREQEGADRILEKQIQTDLEPFLFRGEWYRADSKVFDYMRKLPDIKIRNKKPKWYWDYAAEKRQMTLPI